MNRVHSHRPADGEKDGPEDQEGRQPFEQRADHHEDEQGQGEKEGAAGAQTRDPLSERLGDPLAHEDPREGRRRRQHPQRGGGHDPAPLEQPDEVRPSDAPRHHPDREGVDDGHQRGLGNGRDPREDASEEEDGKAEGDDGAPCGASEVGLRGPIGHGPALPARRSAG